MTGTHEFTIGENRQLIGDLKTLVSDPDGDSLVFALGDPPAHGSMIVFNADGTFIYEPDADFSGSDAFTYVVTDSSGVRLAFATSSISTGSVAITVEAVNCNQDSASEGCEPTPSPTPIPAITPAPGGSVPPVTQLPSTGANEAKTELSMTFWTALAAQMAVMMISAVTLRRRASSVSSL